MKHPNNDDRVILIVPPDKKHLVFDPQYKTIFGDLQTGLYFPFGDSEGNWVYRLPQDMAARIVDVFPELETPDRVEP